ncbi:uncharacterized protein LOC135812736 [Sycon ciliatum]|uniref:uncharacterized protein LOC135812736 n=1 Tax=Sycon ciliatum TaxID=27933 RepID=UPI0031F70692
MRNTRTLKRAICSGFALYSHSHSNIVISHAMANERCQNIIGMNLPTAEQWEGLKALAKTLPENNFGCKAMVDEYKDSGILRISDTGRKGKFLCFGCRPLVSQDTGINYVTPNGTVVCHNQRRPRRLASTTGAPYCVNGFWRNLDSCERVLVVKSHDILQMRTPNWTMDYRICRGHHYPWTMVGHVTCPGGHVWQCRTAGPNNVLIPGHECSRVAGKIYLPQCVNNLWMNLPMCYQKEVGFPDNYDRSGVDLEPRTATFKCKPDYFEQCSTPPCAGGRWNQAANFSGSPLRWDNLPNCRRFHSAECLKSRFQFTWSSTTYDRAAMACDSIGQVLVNERLFEKQYSLHQECLLQTLNGAVMWVRSPNGPMEYKFGRDSMPVPLPNANSEQTRLFLCMPAELMSTNDHCDDNAYEPLPVALLREAKDICSLRRGELVKDNSFFSARCLILFRLRTGLQDPYVCHVPTHSHQPVSERTCSPRQGDRGKMLVPTDKKMDYFDAVHACKLWKGAPVQSLAVNERCFRELQNTQNLLPLSDPTKWHTYEQLPALQDAHLHRFFIPKHVVCWIPGEHVPRKSFLPVDIPLFNSTVSVPFMHKVDWTTAVNECRFRGGYLPNTQAVDFWKTNVRAGFDLGPKIDSIASNYHIMANATEQAQRKFVLCEIPKKYRDYDTPLVSTDCSRHTRLILPNVQPMLLGDAWRECKYWNGELVTSGVGGLDNCLQPFYGAIARLQAMNVLWSVHDNDSIPEAPQQGLQKAYIPVCRVPIKYVRFWCAQTNSDLSIRENPQTKTLPGAEEHCQIGFSADENGKPYAADGRIVSQLSVEMQCLTNYLKQVKKESIEGNVWIDGVQASPPTQKKYVVCEYRRMFTDLPCKKTRALYSPFPLVRKSYDDAVTECKRRKYFGLMTRTDGCGIPSWYKLNLDTFWWKHSVPRGIERFFVCERGVTTCQQTCSDISVFPLQKMLPSGAGQVCRQRINLFGGGYKFAHVASSESEIFGCVTTHLRLASMYDEEVIGGGKLFGGALTGSRERAFVVCEYRRQCGYDCYGHYDDGSLFSSKLHYVPTESGKNFREAKQYCADHGMHLPNVYERFCVNRFLSQEMGTGGSGWIDKPELNSYALVSQPMAGGRPQWIPSDAKMMIVVCTVRR